MSSISSSLRDVVNGFGISASLRTILIVSRLMVVNQQLSVGGTRPKVAFWKSSSGATALAGSLARAVGGKGKSTLDVCWRSRTRGAEFEPHEYCENRTCTLHLTEAAAEGH